MDAAAKGRIPASGDHSLAAVILGNDAVMAARPCTPEQLANACIAAGFDLVVPPSWGDEIVAATYLDQLAGRTEPVIVACACPRVAALRARGAGADLPHLLLASPPVAVARALRVVHDDFILITFVGDCPAGTDPSIDVRLSPSTLFGQFERQGIALAEQATQLDAQVAERWRRYGSVPGGLPALRFLARAPVERVLRTTDEAAFARGEIPASRSKIVVDLADAAQCVCGGRREEIEEDEPARSRVPVVQCPPGLNMSAEPSAMRKRLVTLRGPARPAAREEAPPARAREPATAATGTPGGAAPTPMAPTGASARALRRDDRTPTAIARGRRRGVPRSALAAVPAIVIVVAAALGVTVYRGGARVAADDSGRRPAIDARRMGSPLGSETVVSPERSASSATAPATSSRMEGDVTRAGGTPAGHAATTRSLVVGDSTSDLHRPPTDSAVRSDSAARVAARRRARRAAAQVVPGWLPQGRPTFTPIDTTPRPPDSARTPPLATPPDTGRPST